MKAINILWDVDAAEEMENLPSEIEIPAGMTEEEEISDYITDETGFCHCGFELVEENIEALFEYACSGNIKELKRYFESGGKTNLRYNKFRHDNSLIMGAFRNSHYDTVDYLLSVGETVTEKEQKDIDEEYKRLAMLKRLSSGKYSF